MKRELITLRRAIWPQRDVINALIRDGNGCDSRVGGRLFVVCAS
jgi:Mg2+ and Co2+ transporter CorA